MAISLRKPQNHVEMVAINCLPYGGSSELAKLEASPSSQILSPRPRKHSDAYHDVFLRVSEASILPIFEEWRAIKGDNGAQMMPRFARQRSHGSGWNLKGSKRHPVCTDRGIRVESMVPFAA